MHSTPELIATCWTHVGDVFPVEGDQRSTFTIQDRVETAASTGWSGIGIAQADLEHIRDTIGFQAVADQIRSAGLAYTEVELLDDWWETGERRKASDHIREVLFQAAQELGATHIKLGTAAGAPLSDPEELVPALRELSDDAAAHGVRLALEPMPFTMVATVPMGAELVRAVNRPNCGLVIDSWHVFRAGTTLEELRKSLTPEIVFGVELDDADAEPVGDLFQDTANNRRYLGQGSFDLQGLVKVFQDLGYSGPWGVEIISIENRSLGLEEALRRAHDTTAEFFASL